jgi:hypothetical protein
MLRLRTTAALAGLLPVLALCGGAAAYQAPIPAGTSSSASQLAHVRPAAKISPSAFRVAARQHYGPSANASGYSVLLVTSATQAWAFGGTNPGGTSRPVAVRWNGRFATPSALPARLSGFISDASAPAASDVWAASQYGRYVLHWDGQDWRVAGSWRRGQITGLTAISPRDVWVFGTSVGGAGGTGTWHYDGSTWRLSSGLAGSVYRASAVSRRDIWAIGAGKNSQFILRYDGATWHRVNTGKALAGMQPRDILAISNRNVWVVGNEVGRSGPVRLVLAHWTGTHWTRLVSKLHAWAGRLARGPQGGVLVTATPTGAAATGLILEASSRGWRATLLVHAGLGTGISDVALAPGTRSLLATGGILTRLGGDAAIWSGPFSRPSRHQDDDI